MKECEFMKKYLTHIISIGFLIYINILFYVIGHENLFQGKEYILVTLIVLEVIFVVGILAEMVYYLFKISKIEELKRNPQHYILTYLFNIFYIPCLSTKYIQKDPKYKIKNIVFISTMILLYIILVINIISFSLKESTIKYTSNDENVTITLSDKYEKKTVGEFDLYFSSSNVNVGLLLYEDDDYTAEEILSFQADYVYKTRDDVKSVSDSTNTIDGRKINTIVCSGIFNGVENTYMMSTITDADVDDYVVYVIEIALSEDYPSVKNEMQKILENIDIDNNR